MDIVVPELGESISEATVAAWLVKPGDSVIVDQPLVELETDKATLEIGAPRAGVLSEILVPEGEDVEVGAVLAHLVEGKASAATPAARAAVTAPAPVAAAPTAGQAAPESKSARTRHAAASAPSASALPGASGPTGIDPATIGRTGADGRVTVADLQSALGISPDQLGPAARKWIADHGLDPALVPGTGPGGRISKGDVIAYLERHPTHEAGEATADAAIAATPSPSASLQAAQSLRSAPAAPTERSEKRVKMSRMRRTIAARLKEAQHTAAILTTFNEVDMSAVMALRTRHRDGFEARHGVRLGVMSFFAKAAAAALARMPEVNAEVDGDHVIYRNYVDIGMAVSSEHGLVVPVIRNCQSLSFAEIERTLAALAAKARDGSLSNEEMSGGTFSITNGGVFGSLMSTPILNRPQSAILGLHKIQDRPVVVDGEIVARPMMYLALSYDHRIVDGREAVTFLVAVKEAIEAPERLLLDV